MKDYLQDLIEHTYGLGFIDLIKISGTASATEFKAVAEDRTVVISGSFANPLPDFIGVFGMPNLGKLKTILGFGDVYDAKAKITVNKQNRDGVDQPVAIHFETGTGDFQNDYRLMSRTLVEDKIGNITFRGANWNIEFVPTVESVRRLKMQATVHSEETVFNTALSNGNLVISFGDPATHSGNFVFQSGLTGTMSRSLEWPVKQFLSIMDLTGDKKVYVSDQGAMRVTVDSGLAQYEFLLPAQTK